MSASLVVLLFASFFASSFGQYNHKQENLPNPVNYFKLPDEQQTLETPRSENSNQKRDPKFGLQIGYGNDLQGFTGNGIGTYTPLKIDLGGVVLGTVLGLGAVLLAPKIFQLFASHPHHGGIPSYGRSADMFSEIGNTISRIDENLQGMDIDSSSCLQKAACLIVRYVNSSSAQRMLNTTSNSLLSFFIEGSKLKNAMDVAIKGEDCSAKYSQCSFKNSMFAESLD